MGIKKYNPTSPGRRGMTVSTFEEITKTTPEKSLVVPLNRTGGRNNQGRITTRHKGGGHKRMYRVLDFKRTKDDIPAKVAAIEYDPNRTANIALLHYADGEKKIYPCSAGFEHRRRCRFRSRCRHQSGECFAPCEHPRGYLHPQY